MTLLLRLWIIFAMGWLVGAANAIEVFKEISVDTGLKKGRQSARFVGGLILIAIATTAAAGAGLGLFYVIVWAVNL